MLQEAVTNRCAQKTEVFSRVCGYFRPVSCWNKGKKEEFKERKKYSVSKAQKDSQLG